MAYRPKRSLRGTESTDYVAVAPKAKSSRCELGMSWPSGTWRRIRRGARVTGQSRRSATFSPDATILATGATTPAGRSSCGMRTRWSCSTACRATPPSSGLGFLAGWKGPGFRGRGRGREAVGRRGPRGTSDAARSVPSCLRSVSRPTAEPLPSARPRTARPGSICSRRRCRRALPPRRARECGDQVVTASPLP